jgi:MIP family channel proteins
MRAFPEERSMRKEKIKLSPALAEAIGTFVLVFAGCGAVMVSERFPGSIPLGGVPVVFGLAIGVMVYAVGHISGAHFNPAVTLGFASVGRISKKNALLYWAAQFLGAIAAITVLKLILPMGQGFGATLPAVSGMAATVWEAFLTFILVIVIMGVASDPRAHGSAAGIAIGGSICLDAFIGGTVTGASMNPARSLAPALFQGTLPTLWIYFAGPAIGAVVAAFTYEKLR